MKSKRTGKPVFFVVLILILALTFTAFFGIDNYYGDKREIYLKGAEDIRWGIDIQGGVEAIFSPAKGSDVSDADIEAVKELVSLRLVEKNITDNEIYCDTASGQVIVRFPWKAGESDFDAVATVNELATDAMIVFRKGTEETGDVILQGSADVKKAAVGIHPETGEYIVELTFTEQGRTKFANATASLVNSQISMWLDRNDPSKEEGDEDAVIHTFLSAPTVNERIDSDSCYIEGSYTAETAKELADQINSGKLPFSLKIDNIQVVSPTLGSNALEVMVYAGAIAFAIVCLIMIFRYRMNGFVAAIALLGQLAGTIACISGFFSSVNSFTLTIPGIAGMILSIGVGVDANVIAAERIRDEFKKGKTIDGAIDSGFKNSFSAIIDGNVTIVIVSLVLMGAFGSPDSFIAKIFSPVMSFFGTAVTGSIYSFGYTLLIGVIFNLIMGVFASKLMLKSVSQLKFLRKPWLYGGKKNG
ncbi:MAG: SecD/SecF family protein translocase subunit [Ruminococcaceae bacterium]|nr:SecD/SecF family protein translocase subunit [Oscillospiraceae bacterium]